MSPWHFQGDPREVHGGAHDDREKFRFLQVVGLAEQRASATVQPWHPQFRRDEGHDRVRAEHVLPVLQAVSIRVYRLNPNGHSPRDPCPRDAGRERVRVVRRSVPPGRVG